MEVLDIYPHIPSRNIRFFSFFYNIRKISKTIQSFLLNTPLQYSKFVRNFYFRFDRVK